MFKKCLPVVLALVLAGCGGALPNTPQSSVTSAGTTAESAVSSESIGDYTFSVPSTWTKEGDYFYIGDVGDIPYMYIIQDEFTIAELLEYPDDFIGGVLEGFEDSKLSSGLSSVSYDHADGYAFSFTGKIQGRDTNNVFTVFDNPSGGLVSLCLMEEGFDCLPQYYDVLNTVKTDVLVPEEEPAADAPSAGERNALTMAKDYLAYTAFSYSGLIKQLEYEGFSHEEAVYGADNCGADWKEQAVKKAADYLEYSSFSRDGLIKQLEYEGFTHEEAEYGVSQSYD